MRRSGRNVRASVISSRTPAPVVLVVDDYAATREMYFTYLTSKGMRVLVAGEALTGYKDAHPLRGEIREVHLAGRGVVIHDQDDRRGSPTADDAGADVAAAASHVNPRSANRKIRSITLFAVDN